MAQQSGSSEYYKANEMFSNIRNIFIETMQYQFPVEAEILKCLHS